MAEDLQERFRRLLPNDIVSMYKKNMEHVFGEGACHVLKVRPYGGMKVL